MLLSEFNQFKETGYAYPTRTFVMIGIFLVISLILKNKYLSSLFIFLLFTEGVLRFVSPYGYYTRNGVYTNPYLQVNPNPFTPNTTHYDNKTEFSFALNINSSGFRDVELQDTTYKFFLLGDSFVQGVGTDESHAIDKQLENKFNCKDCIQNFGLSGSNLIQQYTFLNQFLEQGYSSQGVLLNLNFTDFSDVLIKDKMYLKVAENGPFFWPIDQHFNTAGYVKYSEKLYEALQYID
jgi:hypothetical protein